jgi:hypothetical protein
MMIAGAVLCFIAGPLDSPPDFQVQSFIYIYTHLPLYIYTVHQTIYLGLVLIVVVLSTGLFAFYQEAQVDAVMAGFKALTPSRANVVRDGQVRNCIPVHFSQLHSSSLWPAGYRN